MLFYIKGFVVTYVTCDPQVTVWDLVAGFSVREQAPNVLLHSTKMVLSPRYFYSSEWRTFTQRKNHSNLRVRENPAGNSA